MNNNPNHPNYKNKMFIEEAIKLSKRWERYGIPFPTPEMLADVPPGGHWLDGQRLTNEKEDGDASQEVDKG